MSILSNMSFPLNFIFSDYPITEIHLGRRLAKGCDLDKPFITLVVDSTPKSLSLMTVSMGKHEAIVLNHLESYDWGNDVVDSSGVVSTRLLWSSTNAYTIKHTKAGRPKARSSI